MSNNNSTSFLSLLGRSVTVPLQTSVTMAEIALDLVQSVAQSKDTILGRTKEIGQVLNIAAMAFPAATAAGISSVCGRKITKEEFMNDAKMEEIIWNGFMPNFDDEE